MPPTGGGGSYPRDSYPRRNGKVTREVTDHLSRAGPTRPHSARGRYLSNSRRHAVTPHRCPRIAGHISRNREAPGSNPGPPTSPFELGTGRTVPASGQLP